MSARILVIEDDPDLSFLIRLALEDAGHTVEDVVSAEDGLTRLDGAAAVLLDLRLPGMSGLEFLTHLDAGHPPIIAMSAHADDAVGVESVDLGASAYLAKPFDPLDLVATVDRVMATV